MATERGVASVVDAESGELLWRARLEGAFTASPVAGDDKVYLVNESGVTFVLPVSGEPQVLARNDLEERVLASPAIANGRLYFRTDATSWRSSPETKRSRSSDARSDRVGPVREDRGDESGAGPQRQGAGRRGKGSSRRREREGREAADDEDDPPERGERIAQKGLSDLEVRQQHRGARASTGRAGEAGELTKGAVPQPARDLGGPRDARIITRTVPPQTSEIARLTGTRRASPSAGGSP